MLWYRAQDFFLAWNLLMGAFSLSVLAIACSIAALGTALVVALRSTPQRVRRTANTALEIAEETQAGFRVVANREVSFMEEVTRERASAAGDLQEAERKRRQAAAKLSKVDNAGDGASAAPVSLSEALAALPIGDPQRMVLLRKAHAGAEET